MIESKKVKQKIGYFREMGAECQSFITVTEWANGEGYDISIDGPDRSQIFSLTYTEFNALSTTYHAFSLEECQ